MGKGFCEHLSRTDAKDFSPFLLIQLFHHICNVAAVIVLAELETDAAVEILHTVGKEKREPIIDALNEDIRKEIQLIASFDEDEIGSKMTTNCIILRENLSRTDAKDFSPFQLIQLFHHICNVAAVIVLQLISQFDASSGEFLCPFDFTIVIFKINIVKEGSKWKKCLQKKQIYGLI